MSTLFGYNCMTGMARHFRISVAFCNLALHIWQASVSISELICEINGSSAVLACFLLLDLACSFHGRTAGRTAP
jgi:hypothetical protein